MKIKAYFSYRKYTGTNDFTVNDFLVKESDHEEIRSGEKITVIGNNVPNYRNVLYILNGDLVSNQKGQSLKLINYDEEVRHDEASIVGYLSSGIIKGIGISTAKKIYDAFGNQSLEILDKNPTRLLEINGVGINALETIRHSYIQNRAAKDLILTMAAFGVSAKKAMDIYEKFETENILHIIKNSPWQLLQVSGISFELCDTIGSKYKIAKNNPGRVKAAFINIIKNWEISGHTCIHKDDLGRLISDFLPDVEPEIITEMFIDLLRSGQLKATDSFIYRAATYNAEQGMACELVRIKTSKSWEVNFDIETDIDISERELGIKLHHNQREAVRQAICNNLLVITGGPGTGKTAVLRVLRDVFRRKFPKKQFLFVAPTGKAARRITESIGEAASTVHSSIQLRGTTEVDAANHACNLDYDVLDVDETSMLDIWTAWAFAKCIPDGAKLIYIGDVNQLQSAGVGAVLRDTINSGVVTVVRLEKIFRQAEESTIVLNCHKMEYGNAKLQWNSNDFRLHEVTKTSKHVGKKAKFDQMINMMLDIYLNRCKIYGTENIVCLCPYNDNVSQLNRVIQNRVNNLRGLELYANGYNYRIGDPVIHLKNQDMVSNGDVGVVKDIVCEGNQKSLVVRYFGEVDIVYMDDELQNLSLAYALTIHKSQGSEYPCVISCLTDDHYRMKKRNLLYTAISRAKEEFNFVGTLSAVKEAVNTPDENRVTMLALRIFNTYQKYRLTGLIYTD